MAYPTNGTDNLASEEGSSLLRRWTRIAKLIKGWGIIQNVYEYSYIAGFLQLDFYTVDPLILLPAIQITNISPDRFTKNSALET